MLDPPPRGRQRLGRQRRRLGLRRLLLQHEVILGSESRSRLYAFRMNSLGD